MQLSYAQHNELKQHMDELCCLKPSSQSRNVALVNKPWHDKLMAWLEDPRSIAPGRIDNRVLCIGNLLDTSKKYQFDFEIVEEKIFLRLVDIFDGGPKILRKFTNHPVTYQPCVIIDPISLEMHTQFGKKYKTCSLSWKLHDIKRHLCMAIHVNESENTFFTVDSNEIVDENMIIGEYVKLHKNQIALRKRIAKLPPLMPGAYPKSSFLTSTMPHPTFGDGMSKNTQINSTAKRSNSCFATVSAKPVGLVNLGNTCFFNAAMQCVVRIQPLIDFIFSQEFEISINRQNPLGTQGEIALAFRNFVQEMSSNSTHARNPKNFRSTLIKKFTRFANFSQHDSQEVIGAILDGLHEDLNQAPAALGLPIPKDLNAMDLHYARNKSIIVDIFHGSLFSSLECPKCNNCERILEPFMFLSLEIPHRMMSQVTLQDCFNSFKSREVLDAGNLWLCSKCNTKVRAVKSSGIQKCGQVLIIHLKRFTGMGFFTTKVDTVVQYPDEIDSSTFCNENCGKYKLIGAIFHSGGLMSGHYTAAAIDQQTDKWYYFNDSDATPCEAKVAHSSRTYILFYQRK